MVQRPQNERLDIFTLMESPVSALPTYVQHLAPQGTLILSGFFTDDVQEMTTVAEQNGTDDVQEMTTVAEQNGLTVSQTLQRNNWAVLVLKS